MNRRRFLASILGAIAVAHSSRTPRASEQTIAFTYAFPKPNAPTCMVAVDPGAPGGDRTAIVEVPPRHAMSGHVRVQRIRVNGADPDRWVAEVLEASKRNQWRDVTDEMTAEMRRVFPDEIGKLRDS